MNIMTWADDNNDDDDGKKKKKQKQKQKQKQKKKKKKKNRIIKTNYYKISLARNSQETNEYNDIDL